MMIGQTLGRYCITEKLGEKGFAYRATDTMLGRTVVVKLLPTELKVNEKERFQQEARTTSLDHPNICPIFDMGQAEGVRFIVMPYVEGKNISQLVAGRPLAWRSALAIALQVADALAAAHAWGIIHRRINSGSVMVTREGQVKVLDFGLAGLLNEEITGSEFQLELTEGAFRGQFYAYAAPEQIRGDHLDGRADLFSTGVLLYEMLTGSSPFQSKSTIDVQHAVLYDTPKPLIDMRRDPLPSELQHILDRSTAKDPRDRYQNMDEFRDGLRVVLQERNAEEAIFPLENIQESPAKGGAPPGENQSARLRFAIENKYPYPIARPFHELRRIDDWKAQIPQLANILGAALEHVAIVALAEYLSGESRKSELNRHLVETFKKPISHGTWAGVLRDTITFLRDSSAPTLTNELPALYFGQEKSQALTSLKAIGDELVAMRNTLIKKTVDAPPTHESYQSFKRRLIEFLQMLSFVKDYPLVAVSDTQIESGIKTHQCNMLVGFHEAFEQVAVACDLDLEKMRVAMLNPATHEFLYLYPFYLLRECPEKSCQSVHFFRFDRAERNRIEYLAAGGHRLSDQTAAADLHALLQSAWGIQPRLRQKAKYLCLEFAESWRQRAAEEQIAGKYEIVRHLRRGGMADVYQVREIVGRVSRALKLLPFQFLSDHKMIQRFRQEAMQARSLDHPNITRVLDYGEDLVDHYLVMELAEGWNTADEVIALDVGELPKPLDETKAIAIIKQACEGLDYLHKQQIIHRDIKPGNLLLFSGDCVKLADFGIARSRESITLTMTGLTMGTPEYMSPEQAEGKRDLTFASDIYSMGVVMYELLTGHPPFKRATPLATAVAHLREPVPPMTRSNPQISVGLQQIVMKCLEKEPIDRYDSARSLYQEIDSYERGEATAQSPSKKPAVRYLEKILRGHDGSVSALAFAPEGSLLASGGKDRTIRLWDTQKATLKQTFSGEGGEVTSLAFSPDGQVLMSGSYDKTVKLWDPQTLEPKRTLTWPRSPTVDAVAFSPDGRFGASGGEMREQKSGEADRLSRSGEICLWDAQTLILRRALAGHAFTVTSLAFSPNSTTLASGSWDKTIKLWDAYTGELKSTLSGHEGAIHKVVFSPNGDTLVSVSEDQTVKLWNAKTGEIEQTLAGHSSRALALAFSPDGETIASGGGEHQKWGEVKLWNARTGKLKQTLRGHDGAVLTVAFSPNGQTLASGSSDGIIGLWDLQVAPRPLAENVLWVCDNSENRTAAFALRERGMNVMVASSTDEAMSILLAGHDEKTIDFVVSDIGRSEDKSDRVEADLIFIRAVRQAGVDLPVYVFSVEGDNARDSEDVVGAGGNGYVRFTAAQGKLDGLALSDNKKGLTANELGTQNVRASDDSTLTKNQKRVKRLLADLDSPDRDERADAAKALGDMRREAQLAIPDLIETLRDPDILVRRNAVTALGKIGPLAKSAVPMLIRLLEEQDEDMHSSAAFSLMIIDREATAAVAIPVLIEALKHQDEDVRSSAGYVLRNVGPEVKGAVPVLIGLLENPDKAVRRIATLVLRKIGPEAASAVQSLIGVLADEDTSVRWGAVMALKTIGPMARPAIASLKQLLNDRDKEIRTAASDALAELGEQLD